MPRLDFSQRLKETPVLSAGTSVCSPFSRALSQANSNCLDLPGFQTLSSALSRTARFFLGFASLHHCPGTSFRAGVEAMLGLISFVSLLLSCAVCCLICEKTLFLIFCLIFSCLWYESGTGKPYSFMARNRSPKW